LCDTTATSRHGYYSASSPNEEKEPLADRINRWEAVSYVTPRLLRLLLLVHAGIEPDTLHTAYLS
jgi:hypothetical protein